MILPLSPRSLQEALDIAPEDEDFKVRSQLLALYMDRAMTEEAASLLKGPLFTEVMRLRLQTAFRFWGFVSPQIWWGLTIPAK